MRKKILALIAVFTFGLTTNVYAVEDFSDGTEYDEFSDGTVEEEEEISTQAIMSAESELGVSNFYPTVENLGQYSLISLGDTYLSCHIRGSIWCGGTLFGETTYVDDGTLNETRVPASSSYVYENYSNTQFNGRSSTQGAGKYYLLEQQAIADASAYWKGVLSTLMSNGETEEFVYLEPDAEYNSVDFHPWDYHRNGDDNAYNDIHKVYYTDATFVSVGGFAGHLIAPYAEVQIQSCNYSGCVVANNITNQGENHVNNWVPTIEKKEPTPTPPEKEDPTPTPEEPESTPIEEPTPTPPEEETPTPTPTDKPDIPIEIITPEPDTPTPTPTNTNTPTPTITTSPMPVVKQKDTPKPQVKTQAAPHSETADPVQTGDSTNIWTSVGLLFLAGIGIFGIYERKKRTK